jgi:hypothetical protein
MAQEIPDWGVPKTHGEVLKLGLGALARIQRRGDPAVAMSTAGSEQSVRQAGRSLVKPAQDPFAIAVEKIGARRSEAA